MLRLPQSAYAARRARLLEAMPARSALLLPTGSERTRSNDTHFPFRPDSNFYYVTGFDEPEAWALLRKGDEGDGDDGDDEGDDGKPGYSLFVLPKDPEKEVWTGIRAGVEGATATYGADAAWSVDDWDHELGKLLADVDTLYFAFGRHPDLEPKLTALLNRLRAGRKAGLGPTSISDSAALVGEQRLFKQPDELTLMREGARITGDAHSLAMEQVRGGMNEYEVQALLEYTFRREGAWGWAYPSIVGGGANACILHYIRNDGVFQDGDLMLIDAGAEIDGYATDVTRTSPVSGRFSEPQKQLYELVLKVQIDACQAVRPGTTLDEIHDDVVRGLTVGMVELGLLKGDVDTLIEEKEFRRYYMHRTSHWLGLDVHDVGRYVMPGGSNRPLEPGMVLTIEPGLYIPPDDQKAPKAFRGIGIRIEDDVLVTEAGHENLTGHIPKTVAEIEALRSNDKRRVG